MFMNILYIHDKSKIYKMYIELFLQLKDSNSIVVRTQHYTPQLEKLVVGCRGQTYFHARLVLIADHLPILASGFLRRKFIKYVYVHAWWANQLKFKNFPAGFLYL